MMEEVCNICHGTNEMKYYDKNGNMGISSCCNERNNSQEAWKSIKNLLSQFISCGTDEDCQGCEIELLQVMSCVWHYGQKIKSGE